MKNLHQLFRIGYDMWERPLAWQNEDGSQKKDKDYPKVEHLRKLSEVDYKSIDEMLSMEAPKKKARVANTDMDIDMVPSKSACDSRM